MSASVGQLAGRDVSLLLRGHCRAVSGRGLGVMRMASLHCNLDWLLVNGC